MRNRQAKWAQRLNSYFLSYELIRLSINGQEIKRSDKRYVGVEFIGPTGYLATSGKMNSEEKDLLNARNKILLYIGDDIYKKIANKERQLAAKLKYEEEHRYEQKKTRGKA